MEKQNICSPSNDSKAGIALTPSLLFLPQAINQPESFPIGFAQIEMNLATFLFVGFLLLLGFVQFFIFKHRFTVTKNELNDLDSDLETTIERLTTSKQEQKESTQNLQASSKRFSGILTHADIGIFQLNANGDCIEINEALAEMSGLYPKKVIKDGFHSMIHPDDQKNFKEAWEAFPAGGFSVELNFRFCPPRKKEVYVSFCANKILNNKKEIEGYIGWVTDLSSQHEHQQQQEIIAARYEHFIDRTVESHYQLTPTSPILLSGDSIKTADAIMRTMVLTSCSNTFAALHGTTSEKLTGKSIAEMLGGCGPLKNSDSIKEFIDAEYKITDQKFTGEITGGKRVILLESAIGLVENNKLVGIWGSQRNITQQIREKTKLKSQLQFTQQILNSLPADISVKDTRCRYLFTSKRTADRCGIPQKEWVGKTISEIMPGTSKDADKASISTMKTKKLHRTEQRLETKKMSGWTETVQIPLISKEGLVEGAIGLTYDITEHKKQVNEASKKYTQLEKQITETENELTESREKNNKTSENLSEARATLDQAKAEQAEFENKLSQHDQTERLLRHSEQELINERKELEGQLTNQKAELNTEIDKRKKWEELLEIREHAIEKIERHSIELKQQIEEQTTLRNQAETALATNQSETNHAKSKLETIQKEQATKAASNETQQKEAEQKVTKLNSLLTDAHQKINQMTEQRDQNKSEQQNDSIKIAKTLAEADSLKTEFNQRLEEETKAFKQELAQKQIREKTFRQHENELEKQVRELENVLRIKVRKLEEQTEAREEIEGQRDQIKHDLELQDQHRQKMFEQQAEKLQIDMAEERLEEIRMHKELMTMKHKKEALEEDLRARDADLEESAKELEKLETSLTESHTKNRQLTAELHLAIRQR